MTRNQTMGAGAVGAIAVSLLYHAAIGGERVAGDLEHLARLTLDANEMTQVQARVERGPLRRVLILSGPADEFQRGELVRIMGDIPGVAEARWDPRSAPVEEGRTDAAVR